MSESDTLRMIVCGGRDYRDKPRLFLELDRWLNRQPKGLIVLTGVARGADRLARFWAKERGVEFVDFPADWKRYGVGAGIRRNTQMLIEGKADMVLAFPGGDGTENMVSQAYEMGVPVVRA